MAHLNNMGPEEKGSKTGRKLGFCKTKDGESTNYNLGEGMGMHRHNNFLLKQGRGMRYRAFHSDSIETINQ